jgi:hypothetical protein
MVVHKKPPAFQATMLQCIQDLKHQGMLPALFFSFSRKKCEEFAKQAMGVDLDADAPSVRHIMQFYLHRYKDQLETLEQYHEILDLAQRGVAYHHSGLLGILKEAVEILFSRGFIKVLFCTETFAVGINMPAKTVVFLGVKKYDDRLSTMRILRHDEYMQMAGRAGRRGKDTSGTVLYLPCEEPVGLPELEGMLSGSVHGFHSQFQLTPDFLLKTLHSGKPWFETLQKSFYWDQLALGNDTLPPNIQQAFLERDAILRKADSKDRQRALESWKNARIGPAWKSYEAQYNKSQALYELLWKPVGRLALALYALGFLQDATPDDPLPADVTQLTSDNLTDLGRLATEVNEGHCILLPLTYKAGYFNDKDACDIVVGLSQFLQPLEPAAPKDDPFGYAATFRRLGVPYDEGATMTEDHKGWVTAWMSGASAAQVCADYGLYPGNLYRMLQSLRNLVDELHSMASMHQDTAVLDALAGVHPLLVRDIAVGDSLYVQKH